MKRNELLEVTKYLEKFTQISSINSVQDSVIKIIFDKGEELYFNMTKGDSHIFKKDNFKRAKVYNAPFDVILFKRFNRCTIKSLEVPANNRILRIHVASNSSYKSMETVLQFEFTGRNTNCIILDSQEIVLEALRHVDSSVSYRSIKVGEPLEVLPPYEINEKESNINGDIEAYLAHEYNKRSLVRLNQLKKQRLKVLQKKIDKVQKILDSLEDEAALLKKSETLNFWGTLVLSNLDKVKGYQTDIELEDFEGNLTKITLPKEARTPTRAANLLFLRGKKLKRKAKSLYIERENLEEKISFWVKMQSAINFAQDESEINILMPTQKHSKKTKDKVVPYENFFIEGFKIMLGKNEKGNILLLKEAKKRDIWMHIKDIPSCHVIIRTDKQSIPLNILEFAAKLCVDFSVTGAGTYLVDYTQRSNVKMNEGAHVNYVEYKTLHVDR